MLIVGPGRSHLIVPPQPQFKPTPVLLPGKSHGRRSLVGYGPWGGQESDVTERLHFHLSLSCIGEGNGNPLQCSCLENPRDGGACWAAICGVAQSWTRLKWLSSSSNLSFICSKTRVNVANLSGYLQENKWSDMEVPLVSYKADVIHP